MIVNLTCLMENSISLCHQYWPEANREFYHIYEASLFSFCVSVVCIGLQGVPKNFTPLRFSDNFSETAENF